MNNEISNEINELRKENNAVILAHNYQRPEIQDLADFVGDSLELSRKAAETDAGVIIFCGVHFMAETAYILSPDKIVALPAIEAGCPMADMVDVEGLVKLKNDHPGATVVTYINSSAAVKAESDICCTSANAVNIVKSVDNDEIIFTPDENLGRYVARQVSDKKFIFWKGFCPTHHCIRPEQITAIKQEYPDAAFMAHPECTEEVVTLADFTGSTSQMFKWAKTSSQKTIIVGSEIGMLYRLKKENHSKTFMSPSADTVCPNMKITTPGKVLRALKTLEPKIVVEEAVRIRALSAVEKMLAVV